MELFQHFNYFNFTMKAKEVNGQRKKRVYLPRKWPRSTKEAPKHCKYYNNAFGLIMGQKWKGKRVIGVDIDTKEDIMGHTGFDTWNRLVSCWKCKINTLTQTTGSGGKHYLFLISNELFDTLPCHFDGAKLGHSSVSTSVDIKIRNQFLTVEPTQYQYKGAELCYKWDNNVPLHPDSIQDAPPMLVFYLKKLRGIHISSSIVKSIEKSRVLEENNSENLHEDVDSIVLEIFKALPSSVWNSRNSWINMGICAYSIGCSINTWIEASKQSPKFQPGVCKQEWDTFNKRNVTVGTLFYYLKKHNSEKYHELVKKYMYESNKPRNLSDVYAYGDASLSVPDLEINNKYIFNKPEKEPDNAQKKVIRILEEFHNNDKIACLAVKSAYGTGKTVMLRSIIPHYKRIMWVSYRRTLTYDLGAKFQKLGFSNYLTDNIGPNTERLFIQNESIQRVCDIVNGSIASYDLVIFDEIESILSSSDSMTHKGLNLQNFNILMGIARKSKKCIFMDGDISNRSLQYINNICQRMNDNKKQMKYIQNTYSSKKELIISNQEKEFNAEIIKRIKNNEKLYVACMSASDATFLYEKLQKETKKDILLIISTMNDNKKKFIFDNINTELQKYDCVIATPTVESGVSFDVEDYFAQIYSIMADKSTTPRGFFQMLGRVRYPVNTKIKVLNRCFKRNNVALWTVEKVKKFDKEYCELINSRNYYKLSGVDAFGNFKKQSEYELNYQFNEVERLNSSKYYFMDYLHLLAAEKGYIIQDEQKEKTKIVQNSAKSSHLKNIMMDSLKTIPEEITSDEAAIYKKHQEKGTATEEMKAMLTRYNTLVKTCGWLSDEFVKNNPYFQSIATSKGSLIQQYKQVGNAYNYLALIDERNFKGYSIIANNKIMRDQFMRVNDVRTTLQALEIKTSNLRTAIKVREDHTDEEKTEIAAFNNNLQNANKIYKTKLVTVCKKLQKENSGIMRRGYLHNAPYNVTLQNMVRHMNRCLKPFDLILKKVNNSYYKLEFIKTSVVAFSVYNKLHTPLACDAYTEINDKNNVLYYDRPLEHRQVITSKVMFQNQTTKCL